LAALRPLPRLAELRSFARFCTFDAFLRLAMSSPWYCATIQRSNSRPAINRELPTDRSLSATALALFSVRWGEGKVAKRGWCWRLCYFRAVGNLGRKILTGAEQPFSTIVEAYAHAGWPPEAPHPQTRQRTPAALRSGFILQCHHRCASDDISQFALRRISGS
jgi:hypothetical protein